MKGHFITFEGGDGAGKSTLIHSLYTALIERDLDVIETKAPGGTEAGKAIRELILYPKDPLVARAELLMYLADRAQQVEKIIFPALKAGKTVLCDRYNDSTIAYQGGARGLNMEEVKNLCTFTTSGLVPDLTIYLDIDPTIGIQRVQSANNHKDQIEAEDLSFHETTRSVFHKLAKEEPHRFRIIDASQSKEAVFKEALCLIDACLAQHS